MKGKPKKILFISHEASLSGAPFVLLELIKWLKLNEQIDVTILLKTDGPAKESFDETGQVFLYELQPRKFENRYMAFLYNRFIRPLLKARYRKTLLQKLRAQNFDLIYANTMGVSEVIDFLKPLNCPVVSHLHELEYVIDCVGKDAMQRTVNATTFYIVVCEDIKHYLIKKFNVDETKILVAPAFVNFAKIDAGKAPTSMRQQLGIPAGSFVAGGAGSLEWRKGVDLFIEVAIQVLAVEPNAYFVWIGSPRESNIMTRLNYDIKKAGLEERVKFMGGFKNPYPYFQMFDLFLLTSREDPYPLVCIENMYLNNPVICFERSGGAPAFVTSYKFGKAVPYLNTTSMAKEVIDYARAGTGSFPAIDTERLKAEHSVEAIAPKIFKVISGLH